MSDKAKRGNTGKYTPTPVTVTFPKDTPNEDLAGKTFTWVGRGRHPKWYDVAVQVGLIKKEIEVPAAPEAKTDAPAAQA